MKRAVRLLYILDLLRSGRGYTVAELAEKCDVSERTIYDDLKDLQGDPLYTPLIQRVRREWKIMRKPAETVNETRE